MDKVENTLPPCARISTQTTLVELSRYMGKPVTESELRRLKACLRMVIVEAEGLKWLPDISNGDILDYLLQEKIADKKMALLESGGYPPIED